MIARRKSKVVAPPESCPLTICLGVIGGAWAPNVVWYLSQGPRRFSELKDDIQGISPKMLAERLRQMEVDGVVHRQVMPTSPPTVEYSLTPLGAELTPAIQALVDVGHRLKLQARAVREGNARGLKNRKYGRAQAGAAGPRPRNAPKAVQPRIPPTPSSSGLISGRSFRPA